MFLFRKNSEQYIGLQVKNSSFGAHSDGVPIGLNVAKPATSVSWYWTLWKNLLWKEIQKNAMPFGRTYGSWSFEKKLWRGLLKTWLVLKKTETIVLLQTIVVYTKKWIKHAGFYNELMKLLYLGRETSTSTKNTTCRKCERQELFKTQWNQFLLASLIKLLLFI